MKTHTATTTVINLPYYNYLFPDLPADLIKRDAHIDAINRNLKKFDAIFIDGEHGVGKTTLLADFALKYQFNAISYFITPTFNYTYHPTCFKEIIFKQLHFYALGEESKEQEAIDDSLFNRYPELLRKIKKDAKEDKYLYFILDGLSEIPKSDLEALRNIIGNLPWKKAKFIFSGSAENIGDLLPKSITHKTIDLPNFGFSETKEYFKDLASATDQELQEIHHICQNGLPEKLSQVKRICTEIGSITNFLSEEINEKTNLFDLEWKKTDNSETQNLILSLIAFNENQFNIAKISKTINIDEARILCELTTLPFIKITEQTPVFISDSFKSFAQKKLAYNRDTILSSLIDYYENNPTDNDSIYNLPNTLKTAKRWKDLINFLSLETFIKLMEKSQSLGVLRRQFDFGLDASKQMNDSLRFNGDYLRFVMHKSSLKEIEKYSMWENEVEALIGLGEYNRAFALANSAFLKEDKLKMLAILAKQRRVNKLDEDLILKEQIKDLYSQIDFMPIKEKGYEIASYLVYSYFDLAIELVEILSKNQTENKSDEYAFAYLSFFAVDANNKSKKQIADLDLINSKIKDNEVKSLTNAFRSFSSEYSAEQIINIADGLSHNRRKIFLIRGWILNNKEKEGVDKVMEYALNTIITSSDENVPNTIIMSEISSPLAHIKDDKTIMKLVGLLDSQKNIIKKPTKDYVKWQLTIFEALHRTDPSLAKDRVFEIFLLIDEIKDLSIKTDCLTLLWLKLIELDKNQNIEKDLGNKISIEQEIKFNLNKLFAETAFHFRMIEYVTKTIVTERPEFIMDLIGRVNTQERRDEAYRVGLIKYAHNKKLEDFNFKVIEDFYKKIKDLDLREDVIAEIVDRFANEKEKAIPLIPKLKQFLVLLFEMTDSDKKCYALTKAIKILNHDGSNQKSLIEKSLSILKKTWNAIDVQSKKIETGFIISKNIIEYNKDISREYVEAATELKNNEFLADGSTLETYILSVRLSVRAFSGLIKKTKDITHELTKVNELIKQIPSNGERLILWNEVAIAFLANQKEDHFKKICRDHITPLLSSFDKGDKNYYNQIIASIAPSLFYNHSTTFFEQIKILPEKQRNTALDNVCNYIYTKKGILEISEFSDLGYKLLYPEYVDLCILTNNITNDYLMHKHVKEIVKNLKRNLNKISGEQKNDIRRRLDDIIEKTLPTMSGGIRHKGYYIACKAEIQSLETNYNNSKKHWDNLVAEARNIGNLSDKALVLVLIAETIPAKNAIKIDLLKEAFDNIKRISSNYDKANRYDATWELWKDTDKSEFRKHMQIAYKEILDSSDGNPSNVSNLIDVAQQYDEKLAEQLIIQLDEDPARKKLKAPIQKRMDFNSRQKLLDDNFKELGKIEEEELDKVFQKKLIDLNTGKILPKGIDDTLEVLDRVAGLSLSEGYIPTCYFIQNAINKYENSEKSINILLLIFNALYENAKLIGVLSSDNTTKMKNLYRQTTGSPESNPMIRFGERDLAFDYIKKWVRENVDEKIFIIDPYFDENQIEVLKYIKDEKPNCSIFILTSKMNGINSNDNNKISYIDAWRKISVESPPETSIQIVWDTETMQCPFHDRWWIADEIKAGFVLTSINGIGTRDSQIIEMNDAAILNTEGIVQDYIYKRQRKVGNFNLKYDYFELNN